MNQQEFEPQGQPFDEEIDSLRYPYTWSDQRWQEGMPRDEPSGTSGTMNAARGCDPDPGKVSYTLLS